MQLLIYTPREDSFLQTGAQDRPLAADMVDVLTTWDYVVFGLTLGLSAAIGVFYAIKDRKQQDDMEDYQLGGRDLSKVPVALSLSVSFMSAITVLGTPADIYQYGTMYWWFLLAMLIVCFITSEIYIPTFYRMGISSTYEYLEKRFNKAVRVAGTVTYIIQTVFYAGIVIYAPSLALSAVTGLDLWTAVLSTGFVCIFYTTLGGIKAVIWTDVFQAVIMLIGFLVITIKGSIDLGGFGEAWRICEENGRIDFVHFETDPRIRHSFWSVVVGGTFLWLGIYAVSQSQVQRYLCCKSESEAKKSLYLNWMGLVLIISLSCMNGVIMYAYFHKCDPLTAGKVDASDQLLPYLSLQLFKDQPGVTGVVVSCVFSGSLSTVSSGINAMACVTTEDLIRPYFKLSNRAMNWISKVSVVVFGCLCIAMAYVASQLGEVLEAALSILGIVGGPVLAMFTLGLIFNFANSAGTLVGLLCGLGMNIWVYVGSEMYSPKPEFLRKLPLTCENGTNPGSTSPATPTYDHYPPIANLYAVSYAYYACLGFGACLVVGLLISLLTGGWKRRHEVDKKLMYPILDKWVLRWFSKAAEQNITEEYNGVTIDKNRKDDKFRHQYDNQVEVETTNNYQLSKL